MKERFVGDRYLEEDGVTKHICSDCREYKTLDNFGKNSYTRNGLQYQCRQCISLRNKGEKPPPVSDKELSDMVLSSMGYDTNSNVPIHVQFQKKHNLF